MLLKDKVIIISGIGPGLGVKLAVESAVQGAKGIIVGARTAAKLDDAEMRIKALKLANPPTVVKCTTDISNRSDCDALVATAKKEFGRIDCLINSAYNPGQFCSIEDSNLKDWQDVFSVNLYGSLNLTQATIPVMKEQKKGSIVMINTLVTRKPLRTHGSYAASKAALSSASAHLALELGQYGIRVNSTYMGWMWGPSVEGFFQMQEAATGESIAKQRAKVVEGIPLGDIPEDGDCGKAAIFLASDYSCAMTGACLDVNGGEYLPR